MSDKHSFHQKDLPLDLQILNISVNLARISGWVFDDYGNKRILIEKFMDQTGSFIKDLSNQNISEKFKPTLSRFIKEFNNLKSQVITEKNKLYWAERALTWANILQHRAKLA